MKLRTYMFNPSFEMDLRKEEVMTFFGSLDMYKAKRTDDRYIYTVYGEDHPIFRTNYFVGLGATYRITKQPYSWLPLLETEWTAGWKMNLKSRNAISPMRREAFHGTYGSRIVLLGPP